MGRLLNDAGQGTPEFSVVIGFVMMIFVIIMLVVFQKQADAYNFQLSLDAQNVATMIADNINMISQNGHGYYRYFSIPEELHGSTDYDITVDRNHLWIAYPGGSWTVPLLTNDVTIISLTKGEGEQNCVLNLNGRITINQTCAVP